MPQDPKATITTDELISFARKHGVPLGRSNPTRTLNYYIRQGLLPPRARTSDGRFRWGFPHHSKALLLRIRDLKRQGLTLQQIREALDRETRAEFEAAARRRKQPRLRGLEGPDPSRPRPGEGGSPEKGSPPGAGVGSDQSWDYTDRYYALQAANALEAINRGDPATARRILGEMLELAEGFDRGYNLKAILTSGSALSLRELTALVHGDTITIRVSPTPPRPGDVDPVLMTELSRPRPDVEQLVYRDGVPDAFRIRGLHAEDWYRMGLEERRAIAVFFLDNLAHLAVLPPDRQPRTLREGYGGQLPPPSPVASAASSSWLESPTSLTAEKQITGKRPGEWPLATE